MSMLSTPGPAASRGAAENDIYTVLILIAFLFVLLATGYIGYKAQVLFGTLLPAGGS